MGLMQQLNNITSKPAAIPETIPKEYDLNEASSVIQELIANENNEEWITAFQEGVSGNEIKAQYCRSIIRDLLEREKITVKGYSSSDEAAKAIYRHQYGLGELEEFRYDNTVDEIRVAPNGRVFLTRRGKLQSTDIFLTPTQVRSYIERLKPFDDVGASLDHSNPTLELVREDGSRLTAVGPPILRKTPGFALRKHGNIDISPQSLMALQTFDERVWNIMSLLTRGRLNQLICGGVNSGKTTLMKLLVGQLPEYLSIRVLDIDNELRISELYPDREIWELEAHSEVNVDLRKLFATILRLTPDVIIVPEFRGIGEVDVTIEACTRGHNGSMATSHFHSYSGVEDIIRNIAMLAVKEGLNIPIELLMEKVASAFNIIIQTHADSKTGIKKVTSISEVYLEGRKIMENPLVKWTPYDKSVWEKGEWKILNKPSPHSTEIMNLFGVSDQEIERAFQGVV